MTILLIIPAAFASAYYWYTKNIRIDALRKKSKTKNKPKPQKQAQVTPEFRCVVIQPSINACQSAKQLESKPILMHEATTLPLKTCDTGSCHCSYYRYDDRRIAPRRRDLSGAEYFMAYRKNKRENQDRRKKHAKVKPES